MFKAIEVENFLSWESLSLEFPNGVTLIEGFNYDDKNNEGAGKSSIPNALCWGLFGKIPKNIKIDEVIKRGKTSCKVIVYLSDGSKIVRTRNPNVLYLETSDNVRVEGVDLKETQTLIDKRLGLNFEIFCQTIYFPQNYSQKFITATPEQKTKILSEIIHSSIYDEASSISRAKSREEESNLKILEIELSSTLNMIYRYKEEFSSISKNMKAKELTLVNAQKDLNGLKKEFELLKLEISSPSDLKEKENNLEIIRKRIEDVRNEKIRLSMESSNRKSKTEEKAFLEKELERCKKEIEILSLKKVVNAQVKDKICPTCGSVSSNLDNIQKDRDLSIEDLNEKKDRMSDLKKRLLSISITTPEYISLNANKLDSNLKKLKQEEDDINSYIITFKNKLNILPEKEKRIDTVKSYMKNTLSEFYVLKEELQNKEVIISKEQATLAQKTKERELILYKINKYSLLSKLFKELKSYAFSNILQAFTLGSNAYLKELFSIPIEVKITNLDEDGEISKVDVLVHYKSDWRSLGMFSGGQSRRIQIALDLALSDLVCKRNPNFPSLLIFDEVFKDLSNISKEKVLKLLERTNKSILLIEHSELFNSIVSNSIKIKLEAETSTLEEA